MTQNLSWSQGYSPSATTEHAVVGFDRNYPMDGSRPAVVFVPGVGNFYHNPVFVNNAQVRPIIDAGWALGCGAYAGQTGFGNDTYVTRIDEMVAFLRSRYGAHASRVAFRANSGGTPAVLNWTRDHPDEVDAIVLVAGLVDIEDLHDNGTGWDDEIEAAYPSYPAEMSTHNPARYAEDFQGIPIRHYYSGDDPLVRPETVLDFCERAGAEAVFSGNVGHAVVPDPQEVVSYLWEHARWT